MDIIELVKTASLALIQQLHRDGHLGKDPKTDFVALRTALALNKTDIVEFLISSNCGVQSSEEFKMPDTSLDTPLHRAARSGDWATMQKLMIAQVRMSADAMGNMPLHLAFLHNREFIVDQILQLLTNKKEFTNMKNKLGLTYLHIACNRGNKDAIEGFLQTGSAADSVSTESVVLAGNNALHFAAMRGSAIALRALTALPDWRATLDVRNAAGVIPSRMIRAQAADKLALDGIVSGVNNLLLLQLQPTPAQPNPAEIAKLLDGGVDINKRLDCGASVLHRAVLSGSLECVKAVVDRKADTSMTNRNNMTPLHLAMYGGDERIVDALYEATDIKDRDAMADENGLSFFHVACSRNDLDTAKRLLNNSKRQLDAQVLYDRRLYSRYTALHFAVRYGHSQMVEWLIEMKADVNLGADGIHGTPLHMAFAKGCVDLVELLLKSGADPRAVNKVDGRTMLHLLVNLKNSEPLLPYIERLIDLGVDVDAQDVAGNTALHWAAAIGHRGCRCVELLLENGADVNVLNDRCETPFNVFTKANFDMTSARPGDYMIFHRHVQKLKILGLPVDSKNDECYELIKSDKNPRCDPKLAEQLELAMQEKSNEKLELQKVVLDQGDSPFSLYNFIKCRVSLAAEFVECTDLVELAEKNEFKQRFPNFGHLIKLKYKKAVRFNQNEVDSSEAKVGGKRKRSSCA